MHLHGVLILHAVVAPPADLYNCVHLVAVLMVSHARVLGILCHILGIARLKKLPVVKNMIKKGVICKRSG